MQIDLRLGDSKQILKTISENSIDSIVTDPPYEYGFMNKKWDKTGIAYDIELLQECLRVLKPGGYLLAFGSSRTHHRLMAAIEDAGFEIRDTICWAFGSGFPKSLNIGKLLTNYKGMKGKLLVKIQIIEHLKKILIVWLEIFIVEME